jgi:hypothetical protein
MFCSSQVCFVEVVSRFDDFRGIVLRRLDTATVFTEGRGEWLYLSGVQVIQA